MPMPEFKLNPEMTLGSVSLKVRNLGSVLLGQFSRELD